MGRNVYKYEESADNNQSLLRLSPVRSLLIISSTMSIFNLFSFKNTFSGTIRTKPERKFAFFSLNTNQVKHDLLLRKTGFHNLDCFFCIVGLP
jgi:hypothetical protein